MMKTCPPIRRIRGFVIGLLLLASTTACWSSDTLFIQLTPTPLPTPTRPPVTFDSSYVVGGRALIVGQGIAAIYLTREPEPVTRRNRVPNAACYPNSVVEILAVEQADGQTYYRVECNNALGWLAESHLGPAQDA